MSKSVRPAAPPPSKYGKGHLDDPSGLVMTPHVRLNLPTVVPTAFSMADAAPPIWNQLMTSSCVGQATKRAISTFFRWWSRHRPDLVLPLDDEPSAQGIYANARAVDRMPVSGVWPPLRDEGSMPLQAVRGMTEFGVPMERDWPFDPATINDEPTFARESAASAIKLDGYYRIYPSPSNPKAFIESVVQALAAGYPVCFAIDCDQAFEDYDGKAVLGAQRGASLGGHYLCAVGYDTTAGGARILHGDNSWSTSWGDQGHFRGDEHFMARMRDTLVMRLRRVPHTEAA